MNKTSRSRSVSLFASVFGIAVAVVWIPVATNVPAVLASQDSLDEKSVDSIPSVGQSSPRLLQSVAQCKQSVMLGIPMDGILSTINVKEGDRVRQGQILARMDSQIAKANVEMARIESERTGPIRRAEASLMSTSRKLEEICRVFLQGGASPNEQREAEEAHERAQAELDMANEIQAIARAQLATELAELDRHFIYAPFDGIVTHIETDIGASMTQGQPILQLIAPEVLEAEFHLPFEYFNTIEVGQWYSFHAGQPVNRTIEATVVFIDVTVNSASQTFRCLFDFDNHQLKMPAGIPVGFRTEVGTSELVMVGAESEHQR